MSSLISLVLLTLLTAGFTKADTCDPQPQDERIYTFTLSTRLKPFSYINDDGELAGIYPDGLKMICRIMNKKCATLTGQRRSCWNRRTNTSIGLNNRRFDGCMGVLQTAARRSAMGFVAEFTRLFGAYIYVKKGSSINTLEDIRTSSMGFVSGSSRSRHCLERSLGISLDGVIKDDYNSSADILSDILNGEVDATIRFPQRVDEDLFDRLDTEPLHCTVGGPSVMVRKDMVEEMAWMDEGLQKLKDNGDYKWMCNKAKQNFRIDDSVC